jgi:tRNA-specific 2-thiouridylase
METVFMAMSGGIDSSYATLLLKNLGFRVIGITFQLLPDSLANLQNPKACCSMETIHRAKRVAQALSIPHYVINLKAEFEEHVISRFITAYRAGETPNPCVLCNQHIKFTAFINKALSIGGEKVATGHYAIIEESFGLHYLKKGMDKAKDQSYFLYPIRKELLPHILFPLGKLTKAAIRPRAEQMEQNMVGLRESQDICFIPDRNYRGFLSKFLHLKKGPVYTTDGRLLGHHDGIHLYTVGQRRRLGIPYKEPLYVLEVRPGDNCLIVGPKRLLQRRTLTATGFNLLYPGSEGITAKVRYRQTEQPCQYEADGKTLRVEFQNPIDAVTPGQSVVLYSKETVVGGAVIRSAET